MNKCIKITIKDCKEIDRRGLNKVLWDIRYKTSLACNKATTWMYIFAQENMDYKKISGVNINEKEKFGKSHGAWVENRMNEIMENCNSGNVAQTRQFVSNRFKDDIKKGVFKGEVPLSTFKNTIPIIIHNKNFKISQGNNGYEIEMGLFNREYQKENEIKRIILNIDKIGLSEKSILNRLISGEYKQGSAQIQEDKKRKGKWYLTISYSFEPVKTEGLDINKILGVDLGIVNTATMQVYDSNAEKYERLNWKECIINGSELIHFRQKIDARNKQMSIASKCAGDGRIGHGYTTRMKPLEVSRDKVAKFRDTFNHKTSKYIIDIALKYNCGMIQMENLSSFSEMQSESFLKNWSYNDLQNKTKYKAEEKGIIFNLIDPSYTSKRCSKCGNIHKENRDCKNNQAKFKCVVCGHEENADLNAAKNIAIPNIDIIISDYIKLKTIDNKISKAV